MNKDIEKLIKDTIKKIHFFSGGKWYIKDPDIVNFVFDKLNDRMELEERPEGFDVYLKYTYKPVFEDCAVVFGFNVSSYETMEFIFETIDEYEEIPDAIWKHICEFIDSKITESLTGDIERAKNKLTEAEHRLYEYFTLLVEPINDIL